MKKHLHAVRGFLLGLTLVLIPNGRVLAQTSPSPTFDLSAPPGTNYANADFRVWLPPTPKNSAPPSSSSPAPTATGAPK